MGADAKTAMRVDLTEAAARRIAAIVAREPGKTALRVWVEGGGCSGFYTGSTSSASATTTTWRSRRTARRF